MTEALHHGLYLARLTIEALSPISVGSGEFGSYDVTLARDANGLPLIAGTSLQGLVKALARERGSAALTLLGDSNFPSRIQFSDALVHNSKDEAASGLLDDINDPLLAQLLAEAPTSRDHVRINEHGAADASENGKFDRTAVPKGTRFSFELTMFGSSDEKDVFEALLALFLHPFFRPGGGSARGYGKVKTEGKWQFWEEPKSQVVRVSRLRASPFSSLEALSNNVTCNSDWLDGEVRRFEIGLRSDGFWRAGSDGKPITVKEQFADSDPPSVEVDLAFHREPTIVWDDASHAGTWHAPAETGLANGYVLPGSSIRGALRHRTIFHWYRAQKKWAEDEADGAFPVELAALFGAQKDSSDEAAEPELGQKSCLIVDDVVFAADNVSVMQLDHVMIDRFTGGALTGALFNEQMIQLKNDFGITLLVDEARLKKRLKDTKGDHNAVMTALSSAIADLCEGRLPLGAKSSGFCTGKFVDSCLQEQSA